VRDVAPAGTALLRLRANGGQMERPQVGAHDPASGRTLRWRSTGVAGSFAVFTLA
jgi:hypothetical protein